MKTPTIAVRVHIKLEDIESLLYSSYQGCKYWAEGLDVLEYESGVRRLLYEGAEIKITDFEGDEKKHILTLAKLKSGLTAMAKNDRAHFADMLSDNQDMYTADALIQCALFGKIIYS